MKVIRDGNNYYGVLTTPCDCCREYTEAELAEMECEEVSLVWWLRCKILFSHYWRKFRGI